MFDGWTLLGIPFSASACVATTMPTTIIKEPKYYLPITNGNTMAVAVTEMNVFIANGNP